MIGVCCRTPTTSVFGTGNDDMLRDLLQEIGSKHHVLMGDFNYPDIDWSVHSCLPTASEDSQLFLDCLDDNFLSQHVTVPTRKDSILDLVISDDPDTVDGVQNLGSFASSDHDILSFDINVSVTESSIRRRVLDYAKGDYMSMRNELAYRQWTGKVFWSPCRLWSGGRRLERLLILWRRSTFRLSQHPALKLRSQCG